MPKEKEPKRISIFEEESPDITANDINARLTAMSEVGDFRCETEAHRKARYALVKNIERYESAVARIKKLLEQPSEEMKEYNKKKVEILKECGAKEEHHPDIGTYYKEATVEDWETYKDLKDALGEEYAEVLKEDQARQDRNTAVGKDIIEDVPEPHKTSIQNFPDTISARQLASISFMLFDETEEAPKKKTKPKRTKAKKD